MVVHGAETIQPLLNAGLLDEIHVDLAAVLLGEGVRLFDHLANTPVVVGNPTVVTGVGVTHLRYPVHTYQHVEAWAIFHASQGNYGVWLKEAKLDDREKRTVTISRRRGELFVVDMDMSEEQRGHAHGLAEMNRRTIEGNGSYEHLIDGAEPMFGTWHLKVRERDTTYSTTRYSTAG